MPVSRLTAVVIGAVLMTGVPMPRLQAETIDRVLAVVAGELIMLSDVAAARDFGFVTPDPGSDPIGGVLTKLIDRQLILAEVERYAPAEPTTADVDRDVQSVRGRFASQQAFDAAAARSGMDESHLRATMREDLRIRAYILQRFTVPVPNDEEVGRYYRDHQPTFTRGGAVVPFDDIRSDVGAALTAERRQALVDEWVAGLRRRAAIVDLYQPGQ